jgi:two-component system, OmpR family, osmolarity sensor histidine kinase EnvZ
VKGWPQSLVGRNILLLVGLILSSQAVVAVLLGLFAFYPQVNRVAGIVADAIAAASATMDVLPPEERGELLDRLNRSPYIDILPGDKPPPLREGSPAILERAFMQALVDRLRDQTELVWRMGPKRVVWVKIRIGPELYWVAARAPGIRDPMIATLLAVMAVSALAALTGLALARQIAQPLRDLQTAADGLSLGSAQSPLEVHGPSEIQALAASFNRMTRRLASAEEDRALVLAGISHDLRTPLAKLRLAVEMMPMDSDLHATATSQVERMDRLLRQFLDYARGFDVEALQKVDLASLARETSAFCDPTGQMRCFAPVPVELEARPEALRRALTNLIENARAHGMSPFEVNVRAVNGGAEIVVADRGLGVAEDILQTIKTPFRRGDNASRVSGSGLGLAIVERIALLHGGALELRNRTGGGFEAVLRLRVRSNATVS